MKPALEAPRSPFTEASIVAYTRREAHFTWNWHYHQEMELTLILRGCGVRLVGDHSARYETEDLVLLGPNLPHTWFSDESSAGIGQNEAVVIQFSPSVFPESLLALPEFTPVSKLFAASGRGLLFPCASANRAARRRIAALPKLRGMERWTALARILANLARQPAEMLASGGYRHRRSRRLASRLERVTGFIEDNCREPLTQGHAARVAGLSPGAFSRFFRKMTRRTFAEYRNECRIRQACQLLIETDRPVTEVALACGFNNLANFNRRFRASKHMTPREYRRLHDPARSG